MGFVALEPPLVFRSPEQPVECCAFDLALLNSEAGLGRSLVARNHLELSIQHAIREFGEHVSSGSEPGRAENDLIILELVPLGDAGVGTQDENDVGLVGRAERDELRHVELHLLGE